MLNKKNEFKKRFIIFIVIIIVGYASLKELQNLIDSDKIEAKQNQIDKILDQTFEKMNQEYPKEIAPNVTIDRIYRENKKIYQILTNSVLTNESVNLDELKSNSQIVMPNICSFKLYKEVISFGYTIIMVNNVSDKKDIFRVIVDKDTCAKYW